MSKYCNAKILTIVYRCIIQNTNTVIERLLSLEKIYVTEFLGGLILPWSHHLLLKHNEYGIVKNKARDFPGGTMVRNLPANEGDMGSSPGLGRSHMPQSN